MQDKQADSIREIDLTGLKIPMITVYKKPLDYPNKYVARVFDGPRSTNAVMVKDTLLELQKDIANHTRMCFFAADKDDAPCIVGTWI